MTDIGTPQREIVIEPEEEPVPGPVEVPEPVEEPEKVPA